VERPRIDRLVAATFISWVGLWIHEIYRVPVLLGFTPDGDLFMFPVAAGLAYWWYRTRATPAAASLLVYAAINLVGGLLSVMPLDWPPFKPEQNAGHYAVHAVYAVCQLPLLFFAATELFARLNSTAQ